MNENSSSLVIRLRNGTLMFPVWKTRAIGKYRRLADNVVALPVKPNRRAFQQKRGSD